MKGKEADLVKFIIENKNKEMNILNISEGLKMDYKNTYSIIKRLEKAGLLYIEKFGQSNRVKLKHYLNSVLFEAELNRRKEILKNKDISVMLSNFYKEINSKLYVLLLFGSYAKKTASKKSDIDIMAICPDGLEEQMEKELESAIRLMPLKIHMMAFSESQFKEMINAREPNIGKEALQNNVILHGIENYYEMV